MRDVGEEREDCANRNMPTSRVLLITWERMNANPTPKRICVCSKEKGTQWGFQLCMMCVMNILSVQGLLAMLCTCFFGRECAKNMHSIGLKIDGGASVRRRRRRLRLHNWAVCMLWTSVCWFSAAPRKLSRLLATDLCNLSGKWMGFTRSVFGTKVTFD